MTNAALIEANQAPGQTGKFGWAAYATGALLLSVALASPALAQSGARQDNVRDSAVNAVASPLSDLNLRGRDIPAILLEAELSPYDLTELGECKNLQAEVARLNEVLGPDSDADPEEGNLLAQGLEAGGSLLSGLIPFRGVVREISGANAADARWDKAIYAGVTRRSFLKGYMHATTCEVTDTRTATSARELLGIAPREAADLTDPDAEPEVVITELDVFEDDQD